jgi:hypothetical protein
MKHNIAFPSRYLLANWSTFPQRFATKHKACTFIIIRLRAYVDVQNLYSNIYFCYENRSKLERVNVTIRNKTSRPVYKALRSFPLPQRCWFASPVSNYDLVYERC